MKKELLKMKELAAELCMSLNSIQRAYRKEEIPVQWLGRMLRLNGKSDMRTAIAGRGWRRAPHKAPGR